MDMQSISNYNWSVNFQMLQKASSFSSFRKIISASALPQSAQNQHVELQLQSKLEAQPLQLGLESEKSKLQIQGVRSSIDSQHHKKSSGSIPLSQLILRDNGYDYLFSSRDQLPKLNQRKIRNLKIIFAQTQEMCEIIRLKILELEQSTTRKRILELERDIAKLKTNKSKSPIQRHSEYLQSTSRKRKQRLSGKLFQFHSRQAKSNLKTQCDSHVPSLPSAPVTPINQQKLILSPIQSQKGEYLNIMKAKRILLHQTMKTIKQYDLQRIEQLQQQNSLLKQEIFWLHAQIHSTPIKKQTSERYFPQLRTSSSTKRNRRLVGMRSPQTFRSGKNTQLRLTSQMYGEGRINAREQYFLISQ